MSEFNAEQIAMCKAYKDGYDLGIENASLKNPHKRDSSLGYWFNRGYYNGLDIALDKAIGEKIKAIQYTPKGGMCASCEKRLEDCSHLDFRSMPSIGSYGDVVIVKCLEHKRRKK